MKTSKILLASLAAAALVSTGGIAAPPTAPIQVSAHVVANCSISATNMDFGNYDPLVTNKTANALADSTISVSCTKGSPNVSVGLDRGLNATGTQRQLKNGAELMTYSITDEAGTDWTQTLSGTTVSFGHGLGLLAASLALYAWPMAGIAAFGLFLSTVTRNSAASVVGTLMWALLMQLLGVLPGLEGIRPYLLGEQFQAWHGFLRTPADWTPIVRALWVCALYVSVPLVAGYLVFLRSDVAGE